MTVLVTYASKYGGTAGIAEHIAETLNAAGVEAVARPITPNAELAEYDAFVLGSALYIGSWLKEALRFARQHRDTLASRPTWLFSSGPLGTLPSVCEASAASSWSSSSGACVNSTLRRAVHAWIANAMPR